MNRILWIIIIFLLYEINVPFFQRASERMPKADLEIVIKWYLSTKPSKCNCVCIDIRDKIIQLHGAMHASFKIQLTLLSEVRNKTGGQRRSCILNLLFFKRCEWKRK